MFSQHPEADMSSKNPSQTDSLAIELHISQTYNNLRFGMAATAFAFPLLLLIGGLVLSWFEPFSSIPLLKMPSLTMQSMSAYYHTPLRGVFVGLLFAIGIYLYLFKGFSPAENMWLNVAGTFAVLIALLPTTQGCQTSCGTFTTRYAHGVCVFVFFGMIYLVCRRSAEHTLPLLKDAVRVKWYATRYQILGQSFLWLPLIIGAFTIYFQQDLDKSSRTFGLVAEMVAVWTFSYYWYLKGREIEEIRGQR